MTTETEIKCRFCLPHHQCGILSAVRSSRYYVMESICKDKCKGALSDENICDLLKARMETEYYITKNINSKAINRIIKQGGAVTLLHTKEFLVRELPANPEKKRVKPPMTVMLKNLTGAALATTKKFIVDTANGGIWAGFQGIVACEKQIELRKIECEKCPHREIEKGRERCFSFVGGESGCGCFLDSKRKLAASRCICTVNSDSDECKWDEIDKQFTLQEKGTEND